MKKEGLQRVFYTRGDDLRIGQLKNEFDLLANASSTRRKETKEGILKNINTALLFLEQQPEDVDLSKILELLEKNNYKF